LLFVNTCHSFPNVNKTEEDFVAIFFKRFSASCALATLGQLSLRLTFKADLSYEFKGQLFKGR
jgi:hypothetical protein